MVELSNQNHTQTRKFVRFCTGVMWKGLVVILWAAAPVSSLAQIRPFDVGDFTYYWGGPLAELENELGEPSPASTTDASGKNDEAQMVSPLWVSRITNELRTGSNGNRPWRSTGLKFPFKHAWRFAHEAGTRDAIEYGPWFNDWVDSIGETRGWDDGDGRHASYVGHPLNGGIYGFIEQQNDPLYRKVEWGDGRIYWISRWRARPLPAPNGP
jgi:hypothetical protein